MSSPTSLLRTLTSSSCLALTFGGTSTAESMWPLIERQLFERLNPRCQALYASSLEPVGWDPADGADGKKPHPHTRSKSERCAALLLLSACSPLFLGRVVRFVKGSPGAGCKGRGCKRARK